MRKFEDKFALVEMMFTAVRLIVRSFSNYRIDTKGVKIEDLMY